MSLPAPLLDTRDRSQLLAELIQRMPGYTAGWALSDPTAGSALLRVFARYMEILLTGMNQVPERSMLAFLDMLGTQLLPAQAARAPLVFRLIETCPIDVTLPAGSLVAAPAKPATPSALYAAQDQPAKSEEVVFATAQSITLTRGQLSALYSIEPGTDTYADHSAALTSGFTLFEEMQPTEHAIYLGHDQIFAFAGEIMVLLLVSLEAPATRELRTEWEYLTEGGWTPLESRPQDDSTAGMRQDGVISLHRDAGPAAKQGTIEGRTSYWLRGRVTTPLLPDGVGGERTVPVINDIQVRVGFSRDDLPADAAFADGMVLDTSKHFYPFGRQPAPYATFYLACKEVFQRKRASVRIVTTIQEPRPTTSPTLTWEYFDGAGWSELSISASPGAANFTESGTISFTCPQHWATTSVGGTENYWLRARIKEGDYGQPAGFEDDGTFRPSTLKPPIIFGLTLSYTYLTGPETVDHCLAKNDFVFEDYTEAARWPTRTFSPFRPVADAQPAVHFGFDQRLPTGLISLYMDIPQEVEQAPGNEGSPFLWEYRSARGWAETGMLDETNGFRRSGVLQLIGQPDAVATRGLGGELFRVRARLKLGEKPYPASIAGAWLNAVWADQLRPAEREELGASDGNPGQTFTMRHTPVLAGQRIEVQAWSGRGEGWRYAVQGIADDRLRFERDPATNQPVGVWVAWEERAHLYHSKADDRHYTVERATGLIRCGDGRYGAIPPAGRRIVANYSSGGGMAGNLPAGAIAELRGALPYIQSVTNPVPASGGANIEQSAAVQRRGPQRLRHQGRPVSAEDFEWLAREASPDVARVRCLPLTGPAGHAQRGWVTLVVAPASLDEQPQPSPMLRRRVQEHLARHAPAAVAGRIRVMGPQYTPVGIHAEIVPLEAAQAAQVEARVRERLDRFLHPLSGGPHGAGWTFGEAVYQSQIARLIDETPGVDYARTIRLCVDDKLFDEVVAIDAFTLVAAGAHEIKLSMGAA